MVLEPRPRFWIAWSIAASSCASLSTWACVTRECRSAPQVALELGEGRGREGVQDGGGIRHRGGRRGGKRDRRHGSARQELPAVECLTPDSALSRTVDATLARRGYHAEKECCSMATESLSDLRVDPIYFESQSQESWIPVRSIVIRLFGRRPTVSENDRSVHVSRGITGVCGKRITPIRSADHSSIHGLGSLLSAQSGKQPGFSALVRPWTDSGIFRLGRNHVRPVGRKRECGDQAAVGLDSADLLAGRPCPKAGSKELRSRCRRRRIA